MLRLAILSARGRLGTFTGALIALAAAAVLATAWGMQLDSILRSHTPVERYAAATAVVSGEQRVGTDHDVFLTDAEAARLAGHPGRVDRIGVLPGPGFDPSRLRAAVPGSVVLTGNARGRGEYPELQQTRTTLIPVTAAFAGLAVFIAMFVVAGTMGLSIQQREREIALLRAVAATPGQIRRMIAWEATIVALVGSAAGIWPGIVLGRSLGHALARHGIAPPDVTVHADWVLAAAVIACGVATTLLAVLAAGRRAARIPPTLALGDAAVEPRLVGPGRIIGGLLALAGAVPLFAVSTTTSTPETAAATSEMTAICLVVAVGFLGPIVARVAGRVLAPPLAAISPVGGFLASANLGTATRLFSSATTPIVLTVALTCTLLFSTTTIVHAAGHQTTPLLGTILVRTIHPADVAPRLRALGVRYPGLQVADRASLASAADADREMNRWLGPLFVAMIFAFTSIAVVNTLVMIALRRGRELALLRLTGATPRQVRSMARWEAGLIITIGLGVGLAIAATALLPLSYALTGSLRPYVPAAPLAAILGVSALLALLALALPTRRALRTRPVEAIGVGE